MFHLNNRRMLAHFRLQSLIYIGQFSYILIDHFEDYEEHPLTQLSEKTWLPPSERVLKLDDSGSSEGIAANQASWYRYQSYGAAPSPEGAIVNQILSPLVAPFQTLHAQRVCARCNVIVPDKSDCVALHAVQCDSCAHWYHYHCANLLRPPRHGSWACEGCR